jgi:ankyrin repeat protein
MSSLYHAIERGHEPIVVLLLQRGAFRNPMNHAAQTPLFVAALRGQAGADNYATALDDKPLSVKLGNPKTTLLRCRTRRKTT